MIERKTQHTIQDHKPDITTDEEWYREQVIWGFYEEKIPQYIQGKAGENEICSPITAEDVTKMQNTIFELKQQIKHFKKLNADRPWRRIFSAYVG